MNETFASIGLGMIGFMIGNLLFISVGRWLATLYEIAKGDDRSKQVSLITMGLLHWGPWVLVAAVVFAYYIRAESWAPPIFIGAVAAIALFTAIGAFLARLRRKQGDAA